MLSKSKCAQELYKQKMRWNRLVNKLNILLDERLFWCPCPSSIDQEKAIMQKIISDALCEIDGVDASMLDIQVEINYADEYPYKIVAKIPDSKRQGVTTEHLDLKPPTNISRLVS
jgi:hypothetical protein